MDAKIQMMAAIARDLSQPILYSIRNAISQAMPAMIAAIKPRSIRKYTTAYMTVPIRAAINAVFMSSFSPNSFVTTYIISVEITSAIIKATIVVISKAMLSSSMLAYIYQ